MYISTVNSKLIKQMTECFVTLETNWTKINNINLTVFKALNKHEYFRMLIKPNYYRNIDNNKASTLNYKVRFTCARIPRTTGLLQR